MSLAIVTKHLQQWAAASAAKAVRANDPDSIAALKQAEEQFRRLSALVQGATVELDAYRTLATTKAPKKRAGARINALEFWRRHGLAVDSIRETYGLNWTIKAPFGETELVAVPPCWRSFKTERGTMLSWRRDNRIPAAKYWPDQRLPEGLIVTPDYPRATAGRVLRARAVGAYRQALRDFRDALQDRRYARKNGYEGRYEECAREDAITALEARAALRAMPVEEDAHDEAWHLARGYVLNLGMWVSAIGLRASEVHQETIEANRLRAEQAKIDQAAAEDAEVEGEYAEAAD
jgi:hypothetical protein